MGSANQGPFVPVAQQVQGGACSSDLMQACEQALSMNAPILKPGLHTQWALPLQVQDDTLGVLGVTLQARLVPDELQAWTRWGIGWLLHTADRGGSSPPVVEGLVSMVDLILMGLDPARPKDSFKSVLMELAQRMGCDRVSLGFAQGERPHQVWAISHAADFSRRLELPHALAACMDEACDQGQHIVWPAEPFESMRAATIDRAHRELAQLGGTQVVLTVPFVPRAQQRGALVFEWRELDTAQGALTSALGLAPVLGAIAHQCYHQGLPWPLRAWHAGRARIGRTIGLTLATALLAGGLVLLSQWSGTFQIPAQAQLEGVVRRQMVAPFDGYVASSAHRAGESVKRGSVLATLDDRDLRLEAARWSSQRKQYATQMNEAEAQKDRAQFQINMAQARQAEAQRALSESMIQRSAIVAPFDGYIVQGDLSQQLGAAVRKGQVLFELAPLNEYRVALEVDEADMAHLKVGQQGTLMLTAIPGHTYEVVLQSITSVAEAKEGRNLFRVEARLADLDPESLTRLRPAMQGTVRIQIDERNRAWIWTRPLREWIRLKAWAWFGV